MASYTRYEVDEIDTGIAFGESTDTQSVLLSGKLFSVKNGESEYWHTTPRGVPTSGSCHSLGTFTK